MDVDAPEKWAVSAVTIVTGGASAVQVFGPRPARVCVLVNVTGDHPVFLKPIEQGNTRGWRCDPGATLRLPVKGEVYAYSFDDTEMQALETYYGDL